MKTRSLHQGIFRLVIGLVILTCLTILLNVWFVSYQQAQNRLAKDIELAEKALTEVLANEEEQLFRSTSVLIQDYGFKRAVALNESATIDSAIVNHGVRIGADLMAVFALDGKMITGTNNISSNSGGSKRAKPDNQTQIENIAIQFSEQYVEQTINLGGRSSFLIVNGKIYKVILLSIDAPTPLALALVGFELDIPFIEQLENTTNTHVGLRAKDTIDEVTISGRPKKSLQNLTTIEVSDLAWHHVVFSRQVLINQEFEFYKSDNFTIQVILTQRLSKLITEFSSLNQTVSLITFASVIIAFLVAALYSRRLARPISELATIAKQISAGDYGQKISTNQDLQEFTLLSNALENMQENIQERERQITYQVEHDKLTRLFTRYHVGKLIDQRLKEQQNKNWVGQAIGINVKKLNHLNDLYGYDFGDVCLVAIAQRIKKLGGLSAVMAGGEFLWLPNFDNNNEHISQLALLEIKKSLEIPITHKDINISFKLAMGEVHYPKQAHSAEQLFKRTNIVLDEAKQYSHQVLQYQEIFEQKYIRRVQIISKLKRAILDDSQSLSLHYQPKLHIPTQQINAVEALIRWIDADLGFVPPDEFIGIAENAGLIGQVTEWVVKRAIRDAKYLSQEKLKICIAINLSANDISNPYLLDSIREQLKSANLTESALSFEITESDLVEDVNKAITHLEAFKQQGYELAIDDFGTGYSSLAYLKSFPVDTLKIDKSFILKLSEDKNDQDIVETIMQLANKLSLSVVAEGVEDLESLKILSDLGCTWAQGYYLCKPIPLNEFISWTERNTTTTWLEKT